MLERVVDKDQLLDLCADLAKNGDDQTLVSLCQEAERQLSVDDNLELFGDFLASTSFD